MVGDGRRVIRQVDDDLHGALRAALIENGVIKDTGAPVPGRCGELIAVCEVLAAQEHPVADVDSEGRLVFSAPRELVPLAATARARELDACGPASNDDESLQRLASRLVLRALRLLESQQKAISDVERVLDALETRRQLLPLRVPEVRVPSSRRRNQIIVRKLHVAIVEHHDAAGSVDGSGLTQKHRGVPLIAKQPTDRYSDVARRERGARHLIQKRLEEVVVRAVNDRQVNRGALEAPRRREATKTTADYDDTRPCHLGNLTARPPVPPPSQTEKSRPDGDALSRERL